MCIKCEFNTEQIRILNVHLQSAFNTNLNVHSMRIVRALALFGL